MERPKLVGLVALGAMLGCGLFTAGHAGRVSAADVTLLRASRTSRMDLEVSGAGLGNGHGYVRYEDLAQLPQVEATVVRDENFAEIEVPSVRVRGVRVSVLTQALKVPGSKDLLLVRCLDGYVGPYPTEYVAAHEPILVLTVDGMPTSEWATKSNSIDLGPYLISYDDFKPAWHVLAHADRAQVPAQIAEFEYKTQEQVFGPIAPDARFGADSPERAGFAIAKQNCFRCHAAGPYGGTKAGLAWEVLALLAKSDGVMFAKYVHDPKSVSAQATMPGNPEYDAVTLGAVTAYFRSMAKP